MAVRKSPKRPSVYQFKITLQDLTPPIWRRIQVINETTLAQLHAIIQAAMGWENGHLHAFEVAGTTYGEPDPSDPSLFVDENIELKDLVSGSMLKFAYLYDFGDNWQHEVLVEKVMPSDKEIEYPICTAGERACPPEDCGGSWGYTELLDILQDPQHPEYQERLEWAGSIEPEQFELEVVNQRLQALS